MKSKKKNPFKQNKNEIIYKIINCFMAGGLVFLGSLTTGGLTKQGLFYSLITCLIVFFTKFKSYWDTQESEYTKNLFNFVGA